MSLTLGVPPSESNQTHKVTADDPTRVRRPERSSSQRQKVEGWAPAGTAGWELWSGVPQDASPSPFGRSSSGEEVVTAAQCGNVESHSTVHLRVAKVENLRCILPEAK